MSIYNALNKNNNATSQWRSLLDENRVKNDFSSFDFFEKLNFQIKIENSSATAKKQGVGQLLRRKVHALKRSVFITPSNEIFILFNTRDDRCIAKGAQKKVKLALNVKTGKICAYKVSRELHDPKERKAGIKEYQLGLSLTGSSLCKPIAGSLRIEEDRIVYLEEYMPFGDLTHFLHQPIEPAAILPLAVQMASTSAELHAQGYISRDLKPANYFIESMDQGIPKIRLGDFGEAVPISKETTKKQKPMWTYGFVAPEYKRAAMKERPERAAAVAECTTEKLDSWALGMSMLSVFHGNLGGFIDSNPQLTAFLNAEDQDAFIEVLLNDSDWIQEPENKNTIEYVIYKLLIVDPEQRWTPEQAANYLNSIEIDPFIYAPEISQQSTHSEEENHPSDLVPQEHNDDSFEITFDLQELIKADLQFDAHIYKN
jgi:serine/threonine protein kinase